MKAAQIHEPKKQSRYVLVHTSDHNDAFFSRRCPYCNGRSVTSCQLNESVQFFGENKSKMLFRTGYLNRATSKHWIVYYTYHVRGRTFCKLCYSCGSTTYDGWCLEMNSKEKHQTTFSMSAFLASLRRHGIPETEIPSFKAKMLAQGMEDD